MANKKNFFYLISGCYCKIMACVVSFVSTNIVFADNSYLYVSDELIAKECLTVPDPFAIVGAAGMELIDNTPNDQIADDLLNYAFSFEGIRYRQGGKTPAGFDCSGFTSYIFSQFGFELNADSRSQYLQGDIVDNMREAKPGDLIFFLGRRSGKTIGHVGIVVDKDDDTGNITFIHSATSGGIQTDNTSAPYYMNRFMGIRRIIGSSQFPSQY